MQKCYLMKIVSVLSLKKLFKVNFNCISAQNVLIIALMPSILVALCHIFKTSSIFHCHYQGFSIKTTKILLIITSNESTWAFYKLVSFETAMKSMMMLYHTFEMKPIKMPRFVICKKNAINFSNQMRWLSFNGPSLLSHINNHFKCLEGCYLH